MKPMSDDRHEVRNIDVSLRVRALEAAQRAQRDGLQGFARGMVDLAYFAAGETLAANHARKSVSEKPVQLCHDSK